MARLIANRRPESVQSLDRNRWLRVTMLILIGVLGSAGLALLIGLVSGHVSGEEFSPDLFERRTFYYRELPYLRIQVGPIIRNSHTTNLERHLTRKKYISQPESKTPRWDLVRETRTPIASARCDARLLTEYLDISDQNGKQIWLVWTEENPDLSHKFWPLVAQVARARLYFFIPDMFRLAREVSDAAVLEHQLFELLDRRFQQLAKVEQQLGHHQTAVQYFTESLSYNVRNVDSFRGRAESRRALGETAKAATDHDTADRLAAQASRSE